MRCAAVEHVAAADGAGRRGDLGALRWDLVPGAAVCSPQATRIGALRSEIGFVLSGGALVYIAGSATCVHLGPHIANLRSNAWLAGLLAVAPLMQR